ncbi:RagB/SusD family nutrient uptake outer membrane protein [Lewinella sp. JB7]|uniref:RagB/SusD family nutrient uptake outer membrane protein n=1 Tax=Lewinella sp. JB7 TaxID=2962887 RepID=UPI0020C93B59|nr:RagB/SusD family nutrient uptake outer membrane protein [Lewinella sp. JB7]MCP9235840.1 RagB/SusD family nutrient uptake outer membrane protein [Lewinella sp. JB7]
MHSTIKQLSRLCIAATATLGLVLLPSCDEDILNQTNPSAITPNSFYQTADDAVKAIIGAYSPFTDIWYYTRMNIFATDYRDDLVNGFGTSERTDPGRFAAESNKNMVAWTWAPAWKIISRANAILAYVPNIEMDAEEKAAILAEARFLRAYNYFLLVQTYRNLPLVTEPIDLEEARTVSQVDPQQIYDLIIADLKAAQTALPAQWPADQTGRATSGAATGYLARVYMSQLDYVNARPELLRAMNSGQYELMADYADNFEEASENNKESLFEIQLVSDGNSGWGGDAPGAGKGAGYMQDIAPPPAFTGQDGMRINQWALDLFLDERTVDGHVDPRAFTTLFFDSDETTPYQGRELGPTIYGGQTYDEVFPGSDFVFNKKYLDLEAGYTTASQGWHFSGNNFRVLRYADILLLFAEAEFQLNGSTPEALAAINQVRARANMPAFTIITMQDIMDERVKELSMERTRYQDLLRWGLVEELIVNRPGVKSESGGTGAYRPGREYFDIPDSELNNNPNFKHNPGYE